MTRQDATDIYNNLWSRPVAAEPVDNKKGGIEPPLCSLREQYLICKPLIVNINIF